MSGFQEIQTSLGGFQVAFDAEGALIYLGFAGREYRESLRVKVARQAVEKAPDQAALTRLQTQLEAYAAGRRTTFDIPLRLLGTPFETRVWSALQQIPFGETRSYGQLAAELGGASLSRAVGRANGANPISILVPCHRLIGSNGALTGYAGGLDLKERLLRLEGAIRD